MNRNNCLKKSFRKYYIYLILLVIKIIIEIITYTLIKKDAKATILNHLLLKENLNK